MYEINDLKNYRLIDLMIFITNYFCNIIYLCAIKKKKNRKIINTS